MAGSTHAFASTELEDPEAPTRRRGSFRALLRSPAGVIGLVLTGFVMAVAILADFLAPYSPMVLSGPALLPPTEVHPMGTDDLGRDVYSRVLHGARTSLSVALVVGLMAFSIGTLVGAVSGFRGGLIGEALMRATELLVAVFYVALIMGSVMLLEASLGFLGFGDPNAVSWGTLAGQAQRFLRVAWGLSVFPGLALVIAVLGFNLLADGLTDARRRR
jgi:ABC-type dipeptide/oligopeptide/nickel transport system permease subunit